MTQALLVLGVLALATALGLVWRSRNGAFRSSAGSSARTADVVTAAELGTAPGERATFLQLSSEVCAACRSTSRVLQAVAAEHPGVVHVELDVAEHLDLAERWQVLRTPTVLVLDPSGAVVGRTSGATDRAQALAALAAVPGALPAVRPAPVAESCPGH